MYVSDEIWLHIFSHFEFSMLPMLRTDWQRNWLKDYGRDKDGWKAPGRPTLLALCLVNHQFRSIAQQLLYRSLSVGSPFESKNWNDLSRNELLYVRLLRTLTKNPTLAGTIRAIHFPRAGDDYDVSEYDGSEHVGPVVACWEQDLEGALGGRPRGCPIHFWYPFVLLAHTPNVELITCTIGDPMAPMPWMLSRIMGPQRIIDSEYRSTEDRYMSLLRTARNLLQFEQRKEDGQQSLIDGIRILSAKYKPLPNLKEVRITAEHVMDVCLPAWTIEPILLNPNIKTLRVLGIDWYMEEEEMFNWPTHQSNLECLDLKETVADSDALKTIMTRCPKLKSLSVDLADLWRLGGDEPLYDYIFDLAGFGAALREHGGNLEQLSFTTWHHEDDYDSKVMGGFESLRELTNLRHLTTEYDNLLSEFEGNYYIERLSDVLPASIETLHLCNGRRTPITSCGCEVPNASNFVKAFLAEAEICAPNLRKVVVEWWKSETSEEYCDRSWSRETIADGWDVEFVKGSFGHELFVEGYGMALVTLTKKDKVHN